jgi:hypothetical protein
MYIEYPVSPEEVIDAREERERAVRRAKRQAHIRSKKG